MMGGFQKSVYLNQTFVEVGWGNNQPTLNKYENILGIFWRSDNKVNIRKALYVANAQQIKSTPHL